MWTRVVWLEDDDEEKGVIPAVWLKDGYVYWLPGHNALKALTMLTEKRDPADKSTKFNMLIKMKISSGKQVHSYVCISEFKCF